MLRKRLDRLLVERGLAEDPRQAAALIMRGLVRVNGQQIDKSGAPVGVDSEIAVEPLSRYVSRGGLKLEGALASSGADAGGKICLDLGSSTGGFTDCLLQRGARRVYAFDVGQGQLDWKLRQDPRVVVREKVNVRHLHPDQLEEAPDLVAIDLSFISLRLILPPLKRFGPLEILALVKPQFEAEREEVEPGGVIRDPQVRQRVVERVVAFARECGFEVVQEIPSPVPGAKGNREVFLFLRWRGGPA